MYQQCVAGCFSSPQKMAGNEAMPNSTYAQCAQTYTCVASRPRSTLGPSTSLDPVHKNQLVEQQ